MARARILALAAAVAVGAALAACGDDTPRATGTLPPIATTSTTTTVLVTTTTVQQFYEVQSGDSLFLIAERFGVEIDDLMRVNGLTDPDYIEAGQVLEIPPRRAVVDTLPATTSTSTTIGG